MASQKLNSVSNRNSNDAITEGWNDMCVPVIIIFELPNRVGIFYDHTEQFGEDCSSKLAWSFESILTNIFPRDSSERVHWWRHRTKTMKDDVIIEALVVDWSHLNKTWELHWRGQPQTTPEIQVRWERPPWTREPARKYSSHWYKIFYRN